MDRSPLGLLGALGALGLLTALVGCGGRTPIEQPAGQADAPGPGPAPASPLQLTAFSASLGFCYCHHGCGPGIDGTLVVGARWTGDAAATLTAGELRLESLDAGRAGEVLRPSPGSHVDFIGSGSAHLLEPGAQEMLELTAYLDLAEVVPGRYRAVLEIDVAGAGGGSVTFDDLPVDLLGAGTGCQPPG